MAPASDPLLTAARWAARRTDRSGLDDAEQAAFEAWLAADPTNPSRLAMLERGWRDPHLIAASQSARQRAGLQRRAILSLGFATTTSGILWSARAPLRRGLADHASGIGSISAAAPAPGTRFLLDTASAISQLGPWRWRLDAGAARVDLDPAAGLTIEGAGAPVSAEGATLVLRREAIGDRLAVLKGLVTVAGRQILPETGAVLKPDGTIVLARLDGVERDAAEGFAEAWHRFESAPLYKVLAELARYRSAPIWAADEPSRLLVSGRYRFIDPEGVLAALAATLPITLQRFGPLVRVIAR